MEILTPIKRRRYNRPKIVIWSNFLIELYLKTRTFLVIVSPYQPAQYTINTLMLKLSNILCNGFQKYFNMVPKVKHAITLINEVVFFYPTSCSSKVEPKFSPSRWLSRYTYRDLNIKLDWSHSRCVKSSILFCWHFTVGSLVSFWSIILKVLNLIAHRDNCSKKKGLWQAIKFLIWDKCLTKGFPRSGGGAWIIYGHLKKLEGELEIFCVRALKFIRWCVLYTFTACCYAAKGVIRHSMPSYKHSFSIMVSKPPSHCQILPMGCPKTKYALSFRST